MTAVKKKLLIALAFVAMLFAGIALLSACSGNEDDLKVTFMVQEDGGEWGSYREADIVDGSVEMPENPTKLYYNFSNWYYTQDGTGDPFENSGITESVTVYARFVPIEVEIVINGTNEGTQNLVDVVNNTYDPGEGLEFSGWYTNANFAENTKWDGESVVTTLYARSVARITFNNGYEDVYTTTVAPGTVFTDPASADGIEATEIRKDYMSKYDINYWDEDGNEFDFSEPVTQNTNITVTWRSPFLWYEINENGKLVLTMNVIANQSEEKGYFDDTQTEATSKNVPVISVLSEITFDKNRDGVAETYTVESIALESTLFDSSVLKKIIIGEGIKSVYGLVGNTASSVEEIVLPSSLKIMTNSFNNLNALKSINLPDGIEVIIGCFWANTSASFSNYGIYNKGEEYPFEIAIPDSVKNLSMVPYNLTFSKTKDTAKQGDFYKESNRIYKIDDAEGHEGDLLLIADFNDKDGDLKIPEGVKGIQVGAFFNRELEYLTLPSTFSYIGYNESVSKYPEYSAGKSLSPLWDKQYEGKDSVKEYIAPMGYSIFNSMDNLVYLSFLNNEKLGEAFDYAFVGDPANFAMISPSYYESYTSSAYKNKVIYIGETDKPQVSIVLNNALTEKEYQVAITKDRNQSLTIEEILTAVDAENQTNFAQAYKDKQLILGDITNLGESYDLSTALTTNVYLTIETDYNVDGGYKAVKSGEGTATITGYDASTAYKLQDGVVIVGIPSTVTINGETLTITAIAANAFANQSDVAYVFIPSSVKTIGDKAFYNCGNLVRVNIASGGLEKIGTSAFEGTSLVTIALPLANLEYVGANAFKIETLEQFLPVAGEENRDILTKSDLKAGDFFIRYEDSVGVGLYQYESKTENEGNVIWNVKYIATAIKFYSTGEVQTVNLGDISDSGNIIRYEVMSGSYYFLTADAKIYFNCVSKIHTNAFTDCATDGFRKTSIKYSSEYMGSAESGMITLKKLVNDKNCANIFEIGWYEGYTDDGMGAVQCREV